MNIQDMYSNGEDGGDFDDVGLTQPALLEMFMAQHQILDAKDETTNRRSASEHG